MTEEKELHTRRDKIRKRLLKYTEKAYLMLPQMNKPQILDIGCGSGIPTLELAKLSHGRVIGIDIDQPALDRFNRKINEMGFTDYVQAINCSIFDMEFDNASFNIIWSEGSVYVIGFQKGLTEWKRFLKQNGFLIIHDEKVGFDKKLQQISSSGYDLLGYFTLNEDVWRDEYFAPLEKMIYEIQLQQLNDLKVVETLHTFKKELDIFKMNPQSCASVYFIMRRR